MSASPTWQQKPEMTWHPQYLQDIVKPAGLESHVNSMHSVQRKNSVHLAMFSSKLNREKNVLQLSVLLTLWKPI